MRSSLCSGSEEVVLKGGVLLLLARTGARDYADACKRCFPVIIRPLGSGIDRQCEPDTSHTCGPTAPAGTPDAGLHCASSAVAGRSTPTRRMRSRCCTRAEWRDRHLAAGKSYESAASRSFPRWTRHHVARWMRAQSGRSATRLMSEMAPFPSTCGSLKGPRAAGASFLNERPISGRSIKRRERRGWALSRMGGLGRKRPGSFRAHTAKADSRPCAVRTRAPRHAWRTVKPTDVTSGDKSCGPLDQPIGGDGPDRVGLEGISAAVWPTIPRCQFDEQSCGR